MILYAIKRKTTGIVTAIFYYELDASRHVEGIGGYFVAVEYDSDDKNVQVGRIFPS
jgi:hypothetical protein